MGIFYSFVYDSNPSQVCDPDLFTFSADSIYGYNIGILYNETASTGTFKIRIVGAIGVGTNSTSSFTTVTVSFLEPTIVPQTISDFSLDMLNPSANKTIAKINFTIVPSNAVF